jgi:methionyl-tRNA formyltransferase
MRIIFMGTPDFAVPALVALRDAGFDILCVYTQPPRRSGRGKKPQKTPVHIMAETLNIDVRFPASLKNVDTQAEFAAAGADLAVVAAYGLILPKEILYSTRFGCFNIHASLLPAWRGAAPIQRSVMANDKSTGITIMKMDSGLDTGSMLMQVATPIAAKTAGELNNELATMGAKAIVKTLKNINRYIEKPQDESLSSYAPKIDKAEARIDWSMAASELECLVRGLSPFPGAWFEYNGERFKIHRAEIVSGSGKPGTILEDDFTIACGNKALRPIEIQRSGKPSMQREELLRGLRVNKGTVLK